MAKFAPGNPGRPPGVPNKTTAMMRTAFVEAFDRLGGVDALVRWARRDKATFYSLCARLLPREIRLDDEAGLLPVLRVRDLTGRPRPTPAATAQDVLEQVDLIVRERTGADPDGSQVNALLEQTVDELVRQRNGAGNAEVSA